MKIIQIKYNQLGRRNLSDLDKAALLARKEPILKSQAKERMKIRKGNQAGASQVNLPDLEKGQVRDQLAKELGVSKMTYSNLKTMVDKSGFLLYYMYKGNAPDINYYLLTQGVLKMHYVNQLQKSIPNKLKADKRFLLWRKDNKRGKIPLGAMLTCIDPTDSSKCLPFNTACRIAHKHRFDGISRGIGIANSGDMVFIDFDNVIDADGSLAPYVQKIIDQVNSYTEISPSGRGIHILAKGSFEHPAVKTDQVEIYFTDRYFTLTGNIYGEYSKLNTVDESLINKLLEQFRPQVQVQDNTPVVVESEADTEEFSEIDIDVIINDLKANPDSAALFNGDISKFNGDHSSADLSLCSHIIHYAKTSNIKLIDSVFRKSGLMRDKWEERGDYRERTIQRALKRIEVSKLAFEPSEVWAADIFTMLNAQSVRYNHTSGEWLIWDGNIWAPDRTNKIINLARCVAKYIKTELILKEVDSEKLKKFLASAIKFSEISKIRNFLTLAASNPEIAITEDDINKNIHLISCENGTFDAKTMQFRESNKADLVTKTIPVKYDENAKCPEFLKFLDFVTCGNAELKKHFQQFFGLCLTGETVQKLFFWHGLGANGKSTLFNVLQSLLGEYVERIPAEALAEKAFVGGDSASESVACMAGKRLVTSSELPANMKLNEVMIKGITGNDSITARHLYGRKFTFIPEFKALLIGNHKPIIKSQDYAIWRRICLIPFNNTVSPENEIKPDVLLAKLTAELSGILNWALRGLADFRKNGLFVPEIVKQSVNQYKSDEDTLSEFFEERCFIAENAKYPVSEVYEAYQNYGGIISKKAFYSMLRERGYRIAKGTDNKTFIYGLAAVNIEALL